MEILFGFYGKRGSNTVPDAAREFHLAQMQLLFCYNSEMRRVPDPRYEREVEAAQDAGFICHLLGFEDFIDGLEEQSLEFVRPASHEVLLYRGFMFRDWEYRKLEAALRMRGYALFTQPDAYAEAHYLPNHYAKIAHLTPPAAWSEGKNLAAAWRAARTLGDGPWIVKDYVKSAKQKWDSACFIPQDVDRPVFERICLNLLEYQGERFERGFVFRQFKPLKRIGESPYGYPLNEEYRLFFFRRQLLVAAPYDREGGNETDFSRFGEIAQSFRSEFITIDVAKAEDGSWLIIEVGDGGVSLLPPLIDPTMFYRALRARLDAPKADSAPGFTVTPAGAWPHRIHGS